ncbi:tRNA pseudouridine(55) synthase TruB [bacterium]|nr:MAG: tRNA pseudouridine(55) synthase TruB [bacterium]
MSAPQNGLAPMARLLCVDKPEGRSSFAVVRDVRRITGYKRVGHGGTLDPFATGLLVIGLGPATRLMRFLSEGSKEYEAEIEFGAETDSEDRTGERIRVVEEIPTAGQIQAALSDFSGTIQQVPPRLSAVHVNGERSYRRARRGEEFALAPRPVTIHDIELLGYEAPRAHLRICCGGGTYIRSLARDLGRALGSAAHVAELRRTKVAGFCLDQALTPDALAQAWKAGERGLDPAALVAAWPSLRLDAQQVVLVRHGGQPQTDWWPEEQRPSPPRRVALLDEGGSLVAVALREEDAPLRLALVLPEAG